VSYVTHLEGREGRPEGCGAHHEPIIEVLAPTGAARRAQVATTTESA
jgi:hypothetical protein